MLMRMHCATTCMAGKGLIVLHCVHQLDMFAQVWWISWLRVGGGKSVIIAELKESGSGGDYQALAPLFIKHGCTGRWPVGKYPLFLPKYVACLQQIEHRQASKCPLVVP